MRIQNEESNSLLNLVEKSPPYFLFAFVCIISTLIFAPLFFLVFNYTFMIPPPNHPQVVLRLTSCDYADGEWVRDDPNPLYYGRTCGTIRIRNCLVMGRPEQEFLGWRWKTNQCNLSRFDPKTFLDLMKNKHIAFVGDSSARNQFESLFCMVSTVSESENLYGNEHTSGRWRFPSHNLIFSFYYSPFLVKGVEKNRFNTKNTIFLDKMDEIWTSELKHVDILIMSAGHSFFSPSEYYQRNAISGCHELENCTKISNYEAFGMALETTFDEVMKSKELIAFFTTLAPDHYEGDFENMGTCPKTQPYNKMEHALGGRNAEMRRIQIEKVKGARTRSERASIEVLDITELAWLRPDGHPGPFFHYIPSVNDTTERIKNDCVSWCLPGPVDTWNEILFDVIKNTYKYQMG